MEDFHKFIDLHRKQRHDFMNDVQVIYGYLQLKREEETKKYIDKVIEQNKTISKVYALGDKYLGFFTEQILKKLWEREITVELDIEIESFSKEVFLYEYNKKSILVNNIFSEIENNKYKFVYIYIFEDEMGESLLIANNESSVNELDWMDEWEEIDSTLNDVKIHKYILNNTFAYRLTFI